MEERKSPLKNVGRAIFVSLYAFAPFLIVPILAYTFGNWFLLFGIIFSFAGSNPSGTKFVGLFSCLAIGVWIGKGFDIHQYVTFYYFCSLWGCLTWSYAEHFDQRLKEGTLDNDAEMQKHLRENKEEIDAAVLRHIQENPGTTLSYDDMDKIVRGVHEKKE